VTHIEDTKCKTCKYFEAHFKVKPKKINSMLTQMGGVYGYCRALEEDAVTLPVWMRDLARAAESPLTTEDYGRYCGVWTAQDADHDAGDPQSAEHA
jgi:hypothetical protein